MVNGPLSVAQCVCLRQGWQSRAFVFCNERWTDEYSLLAVVGGRLSTAAIIWGVLAAAHGRGGIFVRQSTFTSSPSKMNLSAKAWWLKKSRIECPARVPEPRAMCVQFILNARISKFFSSRRATTWVKARKKSKRFIRPN